ncbi:N-acetylmuramoyl-L-alanine amidase [Gimibacter soli]|uniref:N-acetylmuramoyl-L-alanine amidase n=1 Tax=Gimibacter soli TaxID=3024400 RepID=A0AAE9XSD7_9PROT|nr:N-acetylmuramoyl-L-alanine amidase [Gimibacter soli]WCL55436.1 N-acetylmuramoyl-L-alanine amidase [Gimibacter soli]
MQAISHPSPNRDARAGGITPDMVILHYTGMETGEAALARLVDPSASVSAHYLVEEDGRIFQLVDEADRAWHAGVSHWQGREALNHHSIGIEIVNPGHEFGYRAFPEAQIAALLALLADIAGRRAIRRDLYIGHSDVAPDRKTDPGELFPWERLAAAGFGVMPAVEDAVLADTGDAPADQLAACWHHLAEIGYRIDANDPYGKGADIVAAFQRHWRRGAVTGQIDRGTAAAIASVRDQIIRLKEAS